MRRRTAINAMGFAALTALATAAACDGDGASDNVIAVTFNAVVGSADARCGQTYPDVGTTASTIEIKDLRFYVHDVRLVDASGDETALTLVDDGKWQNGQVALLDFEDKSGSCVNGTTDTNHAVRGTAPAGDYTGLALTIGVPAGANHLDVATATSPLNLSGMFWSWTNGYKFARIDIATTGQPTGYNMHVGSTGCTDGGAGLNATCTTSNLVQVSLPSFDVATDTVVLDLAALFGATDIDSNAPPAAGCQSSGGDPDCPAIFDRLGLAFDGIAPSGPQQVFSAR